MRECVEAIVVEEDCDDGVAWATIQDLLKIVTVGGCGRLLKGEYDSDSS